jgi:hypothetical protein
MASLNPTEMLKQYTSSPTYDKTTTTPISQQEKYNRGQKLDNEFQNQIISYLSNPDIDPNRANAVTQLAKLYHSQVEQLKPDTYSYSQYDPTKPRVKTNDRTGEETTVSPGIPKNDLTKLDEHLNEQGHRIVKYQNKDTGEITIQDEGVDWKYVGDNRRADQTDRRLNQNDVRMNKSDSQTKQVSNQLKLQDYKGQLNDLNSLQPTKKSDGSLESAPYEVTNRNNGAIMFLTEAQWNNQKKTMQDKINVLNKNLSEDQGGDVGSQDNNTNTRQTPGVPSKAQEHVIYLQGKGFSADEALKIVKGKHPEFFSGSK